jgi:DNA (cytosine-5)-methyltransferase 1
MYFNDHEPYVCAWLRNLFPGAIVDDRSILAVEPADLVGHTRCHFFAGIGGWEYALQLAGWPDDAPIWTASLPCQPFSAAGRNAGVRDQRHLWPAFRRLVTECRPPVIVGEQVASKAGRQWLAGIRHDLEELGYAVGAADLCAASVGAPHIRQRLFWIAEYHAVERGPLSRGRNDVSAGVAVALDGRLGDADDAGSQGRHERGHRAGERLAGAAGVDGGGMGDTLHDRRGGRGESEPRGQQGARGDEPDGPGARRPAPAPWADAIWLPCLDGKARRVEPGIRPLAHGVPARVGRLRAYGNAIVPQVAAEFIAAVVGEVPAPC